MQHDLQNDFADHRSSPHRLPTGTAVRKPQLPGRPALVSSAARHPVQYDSATDEDDDFLDDGEGGGDWRAALKEVTGYDPSRYGILCRLRDTLCSTQAHRSAAAFRTFCVPTQSIPQSDVEMASQQMAASNVERGDFPQNTAGLQGNVPSDFDISGNH